jgi:hypothetical protein
VCRCFDPNQEELVIPAGCIACRRKKESAALRRWLIDAEGVQAVAGGD